MIYRFFSVSASCQNLQKIKYFVENFLTQLSPELSVCMRAVPKVILHPLDSIEKIKLQFKKNYVYLK